MLNEKVQGFMQLIVVIAFITGSFAVSALLQSQKKQPNRNGSEERSIFVETQSVSPSPFQISFDTTGTLEARARIDVVPQVSGRIVKISDAFFEGGMFEAEDVLFEIEPLDFELEVQRLEAEVARARTSFNIEEAESKAAIMEWEQFNPDKPVPSLVARKPQKAEAWANLKAAKAQLENAKLDLERTKFTLPYAGRVLSTSLEEGQYVATGQGYGEVFNLETLEVRAALQDQQLEWLFNTEDPKVIITATYQGQTQNYDGYLRRGVSSLDSQTRFGTVAFGFKEPAPDLLPGVFVNIKVEGPQMEGIAVLPASAWQKDDLIWSVSADNSLKQFAPEIIYADGQTIAVRGLPEDINLVTSRLSGVTEGMAVQTEQQGENTR